MSATYIKNAISVSENKPVPRLVRLFRNYRNQAIRTPVEFEIPGTEAVIGRDGHRLIVEPVRDKALTALLDSWEPWTEDFPEIADQRPVPEKIF
jgi:antitoxin VapB